MALIRLVRHGEPKTTQEYRIMADLASMDLEGSVNAFFGDIPAPSLDHAWWRAQEAIKTAPGNTQTYKYQNPISVIKDEDVVTVIVTGISTNKERKLCSFERIKQQTQQNDTMSNFKNVLISDIRPDPNQPRQYYDETAMQELIDSVRGKGVQQPILLRPIDDGKHYLIVCGERRYRAAKAIMTAIKDRNTIPAMIREMSADEALELQIIENLQRKDVHPMEEAVAFKSLVDHGKSAEDVATRVGKSVFYVRQRVKLNALSKEWQKVFYSNRLSVSDAMKVAQFEAKVQADLLAEYGDRSGEITFNNWQLSRYQGDINGAPFDITDPTLNKKMGACIGCQFNSATASLFPDAGDAAKCSNISCFKNKSDIAIQKTFKEALLDPAIVFIHSEYSSARVADTLVASAEKEGHKVLPAASWDRIVKPELEPFDDWKEDLDEDDYAGYSEERLRAEYQKDIVAEYEEDLADYEKRVASGKYKKALMLTGSDRGKYAYIKITKDQAAGSNSSKATKEKEAAGNLTSDDIDAEIKRIQDRMKRAAEIDMEKVHAATLDQLGSSAHLKKSGLVNPLDRGIMIFLLLEKVGGYRVRDFVSKHIKAIPAEPFARYKWNPEYFEKLSKVSDEDLSLLIRQLAFLEYGNKNVIGSISISDTALRIIAGYAGVKVSEIELEQEGIANLRKEKADKRIAALRQKKKELTKPATKKESAAPAPKKVARANSKKT